MKLVIKLNMDTFSKTMEQNVFKLCVIVTSYEHYRYTLLCVTFDLYEGHKVNAKLKWVISISQELFI